jgi:hypothetical protein
MVLDRPRLGLLQTVVKQFGDFLTIWPALFEAASVLKHRQASLLDLPTREAHSEVN